MAKGKVAKGFDKLKGVKITRVIANAINEVLLFDDDGNYYRIEAEAGPLGIPVLELQKYKEVKYELPRVPRVRVTKPEVSKALPPVAAWPYPPAKKAKKEPTLPKVISTGKGKRTKKEE